jgi:hypothetical protein
MNRRIAAIALAAGFALMAAAGPAQAGNGGVPGGHAVGQNPLRLALTQCSSVGGGNVADGLRLGVPNEKSRWVSGDCLQNRLARYSIEELRAADARLGEIEVIVIYPELRAWLDGYLAAPA